MTQPLEPLPEAYVGVNNPYRGIEQHGVESPHRAQPVPGYGDTVQVEYESPAPLQEPVPVIVVNESAKEERDWGATSFTVTDVCQQILGRDERRTVLKVLNLGPNTVYLHPDAHATTWMGFPVAINASETFESETAVYAICEATESADLRLKWEFRRTLPNK
jgi:hypothetical protein